MSAILSVVKNGRVEVDAPPDWPEGSPVRVELGLIGRAVDDEKPESPEEIEAWIRRFREIEPIELTPEEEVAWDADRKAQKEYEIATAAERDRRIEEIFEWDVIFSTQESWATLSAVGLAWQQRLKKLGGAATGSEHAGLSLANFGSVSKGAKVGIAIFNG
jgi:hypothetical protein